MKVADAKCLLVSNFIVYSLAHTVVLWCNMNMSAGPLNLLTKYTRHFNTPLACGNLIPCLFSNWSIDQLSVSSYHAVIKHCTFGAAESMLAMLYLRVYFHHLQHFMSTQHRGISVKFRLCTCPNASHFYSSFRLKVNPVECSLPKAHFGRFFCVVSIWFHP